MKLAFVSANKGLSWGGSEELWSAAANRAINDGHAVALCIFNWQPPARQVVALQGRGAKLIPIPLRRPKITLFRPRHPWLRDLAAFEPDVVCVSQGQEYDLAGRRWGPSLTAWLRSSRTPAASIVQYNDDAALPTPRTAQRARDFIQLVKLNAYVARRNLEQTERALAITIPNAAVVRNPVNLTHVSPLLWPAAPGSDELKLACVARLHVATKGQDLLLGALGLAKWKNRSWSLSLFGAGPDEQRFREMAEHLGIAERVHFRGFAADVRSLWADHHALVLPSRGEGTPLAMVEAMLLGRPCIVTDVGDCAAWVRDGQDGWIAPTPSIDAIDAALDRAWSDRSHCPDRGTSAAARARELFDPDAGRTLLDRLLLLARS